MEEEPKKFTYALDIKIYEPANIYDIPVQLPEKMSNSDALLKMGYHTVPVHCTEKALAEFEDWVSKHQSIMKIIGVTRM